VKVQLFQVIPVSQSPTSYEVLKRLRICIVEIYLRCNIHTVMIATCLYSCLSFHAQTRDGCNRPIVKQIITFGRGLVCLT
jgi:hypothetical protein